ncbi:predicted protein [Botrytis cinerea T4]|uniref:Uncharacterized protein n=1 Tax=Botryotinia fuckeliana (strain T4) TaxID=999810 RepID=G2YS44_BOTF4|nr:predicted protein [Botrytis cinerea T4]
MTDMENDGCTRVHPQGGWIARSSWSWRANFILISPTQRHRGA